MLHEEGEYFGSWVFFTMGHLVEGVFVPINDFNYQMIQILNALLLLLDGAAKGVELVHVFMLLCCLCLCFYFLFQRCFVFQCLLFPIQLLIQS